MEAMTSARYLFVPSNVFQPNPSSSSSLKLDTSLSINPILTPQSMSKFTTISPLMKSNRSLVKCNSSNVPDENEDDDNDTPIEKNFAEFPTVMDINRTREILPHRFPFLLVDRLIEYKPGVTAVVIKNVTINDNFFTGHFPERPTMPGVLMVEAMAQVGGLVMLQPEVGGSRENFFFCRN